MENQDILQQGSEQQNKKNYSAKDWLCAIKEDEANSAKRAQDWGLVKEIKHSPIVIPHTAYLADRSKYLQ